jgi:hypothetical protein
MSKMGSQYSFGHFKHKLWPKERPGVKLAIWLLTTKSQELTWFPYAHVAWDIPLKSSWWGLQLCFKPHLNQRSTHKVMGPKVVGVPTLGISGLPFGSLKQNVIWMWALWRGTEYTIRGKVVTSPKSRPCWILWVHVYPWFVLTPKLFQLCTNQLFFYFVQVRVSD